MNFEVLVNNSADLKEWEKIAKYSDVELRQMQNTGTITVASVIRVLGIWKSC